MIYFLPISLTDIRDRTSIMKNNPWLVRLRNTSIPEHKLRPAKWLALIALLLLAQLMVESLLLNE